MVTGASTADLAIVLVDAREGLLTQSRRHAAIAGLLRIPRIVLAVNKMDLVGYDQDVFRRICGDFRGWAARLDVEELACIPISALKGDNVVERSEQLDWYGGPTLLQYLEDGARRRRPSPTARCGCPVQYVIRARAEHRALRGPARRRHRAGRATRSSCFPPARARASPPSTARTGRVDAPARRSRSPCARGRARRRRAAR